MYKFQTYFLPVLFLLLSAAPSFAQDDNDKAKSGTVKGRVISDSKTPVAYVSVALLKDSSSAVNGALTDEDGKFVIEQTGTGTFMIKVNGIGYEDKIVGNIMVTDQAPVKNVGNIVVKVVSNTLDAVQIKGERPLMEMGIDKKVFNVEKNTTTAGGSASDVLQNVPSVSVDADGGVSLRGKSGVTILIDGKPATLLGGDDANALQSLPASSIESVEVITNPSAKYDAQGMTGIINIVTKREKKFGLNGSVNVGVGTRDKYNGGLSLNLKNEKWNVFLNSNYRRNRRFDRTTIQRWNDNDPSYYLSEEDGIRKFDGFFNSIGAEYTFDKKNSLMLTQNVNVMRWGSDRTTNYSVFEDINTLESRQERESGFGGGPLSLSTNLNYKHKFAEKDHQFSTDITYANSWVERDQYFTTRRYNANDVLVGGPIYQKAPGDGTNSSVNAQADYVRPLLTENGKLETGAKAQLFWFSSSNAPVLDSPGVSNKVDSVLLNSYDYTQQIYAAYTSFSDQQGKFRYQLGLRMEYAYYEGTNQSVNGNYTNEFLNLFPSVFTSYELPNDQSIYLNYSRRVDRPRFWHLLPYLDLSNPQDTSVGNPDLIPEFIHNIELNYNKVYKKGHNIIVGVYYQNTQNLITRYRRFYEDGTTYTQRRNLNTGVTYGAELTGRLQITKWWDATVNANFFQNEIQGGDVDPTLDNSGFGWFGKINTNFKLPGNFSLQLNANYNSQKIEPQGIVKQVYWIDAAIRKNLLKDKATLVLNVSDIFNTRKYTNEYDLGYAFQTQYRDRETRIGNLSFTYRFGSSDIGKGGFRRGGSKKKPVDVKPDDKNRDENIKESNDDGGGF